MRGGDSMCKEEEDKDMSLAYDIEKKDDKANTKNSKSKIPHLNVVNGKVQIDGNDPAQRKWFEEFKR